MRYTKLVRFYSVGRETYNPDTGQMETEKTLIGTPLCAIYDLSMEDRKTLLGDLKIRGLTIHHRGLPLDADMAQINGKTYWVKGNRHLSYKATYLVEESQDEN